MALAFSLSLPFASNAQSIGPGIGGGAVYDSATLAYAGRARVTNAFALERLDGFVKSAKQFGLWSKIYDAVPFSSILQTSNGNNLASFKNNFSTLHATNGPLRGRRGISFDGTDDRIFGITRAVLPAFTVALSVAGSTNNTGVNPTTFEFLDSGLSQYHGVKAFAGPYDQSYYFSQGLGGGTTFDNLIHYEVGGPFRGYSHEDPVRKILSIGNDNSGVSLAWVNGANTLLTGSSVTRTFTTGASVLNLGSSLFSGTPAAFWRGVQTSLVLFNSKLSHTESSNLVEVMRWLDPATENLVIIGDSFSDQQSQSGPYAYWESWPSAMELFPAISNRFWIVNSSYNGVQAAGFDYASGVKPFAPGKGGVEEATALIYLGYNDAFVGVLGQTVWRSLNSLAERCRADGFKVGIVTLPLGRRIVSGASVGESVTNVQTFTGLILSNRENFNFVLRMDSVIGSTNQPGMWNADGIHLLGPGQEVVAKAMSDALGSGEDIGERGRWVQSWTNNGAAATDLLFRSQPPNELRKPGDSITYRASGGFTNETTLAKLVTFQYGSQEVVNSGSMTLHRGPWSLTTRIQMLTETSQLCESVFSSPATNFTQVMFTSQTNFIPTLMKVTATAPLSGCVTNMALSWEY